MIIRHSRDNERDTGKIIIQQTERLLLFKNMDCCKANVDRIACKIKRNQPMRQTLSLILLENH